jgi:hypothetical protein
MTDRVVPPPRWATAAGYLAVLLPVVGFVPLHAAWALGVAVAVDEPAFRAWYDPRPATVSAYLLLLCALALAGAVLALALVRPFGQVLAGRRVPRWTVLLPAWLGTAVLVLQPLAAAPGVARLLAEGERLSGVFDAWVVAVVAYLVLLPWGMALGLAALGYQRSTRRAQ